MDEVPWRGLGQVGGSWDILGYLGTWISECVGMAWSELESPRVGGGSLGSLGVT